MKEEWKVFIRANENRGSDVIKVLTDLGAINYWKYAGNYPDSIYYITHSGSIGCLMYKTESAEIIMDNYRELKLPEKQWKEGDILFNESHKEFAVFKQNCVYTSDKVVPYFVTNCGKCLTNESIYKKDFRLATNAEIELFYKYLHSNGKDWNTDNKKLVSYKWKPNKGDLYWVIDVDGHLTTFLWDNSSIDYRCFNFGNCFRTEKEAIIISNKIKKLLNAES